MNIQIKKITRTYGVLLLLNILTQVNAATFHVCDCSSGSDADCIQGQDVFDGSIGQPFQSIAQANQTFNTLAAGDSIQFCDGGVWETSENLRWVNPSCQQDNMCTISNYTPLWASGDEQKPLINFLNGVNGFNLADSGNAEHEEGYLIENLDLRGSNNGSGVTIANDVDDLVLNNLTISYFRIGVNLGSSNDCNLIDPNCDGKNDRITLKDSSIQHNDIQGWLGSSNDVKILDNYFSDNGSRVTFDHNIYISAPSHDVTNGIVISGNQLYRNTLDENGMCSAVSLVVHGQHDNMVIKNNTIWEDIGTVLQGCWGIAVDGGHSEAESFTNILIQNNRIINVGRVGIGLGSCANCTVENNIISNSQDIPIRAILAPDRNAAANDLPLDNITVRNNSIYIDNSFGGTAITVGTMGDDHIIVSNAIHYTGNSNSFNCFDTNLSVSSYFEIDNNLCYAPNAINPEWSNNFGSLSQWQLSTGFSMNALEMNPGYFDPGNNQLWAVNQDAAIVNTGHPAFSSTLDFNSLPRDVTPDIGAYEWVSGDPLFTDGFEE